jgi:hypothetical protein
MKLHRFGNAASLSGVLAALVVVLSNHSVWKFDNKTFVIYFVLYPIFALAVGSLLIITIRVLYSLIGDKKNDLAALKNISLIEHSFRQTMLKYVYVLVLLVSIVLSTYVASIGVVTIILMFNS